MMHKSVAGEFQKEVDNTTDLLDDILSILALLEAGDWSEHCTKTELGGRLEREITRLISDAQNDLSPEHLLRCSSCARDEDTRRRQNENIINRITEKSRTKLADKVDAIQNI